MGPLIAVELDPVANDVTGVLQGFEAVCSSSIRIIRSTRPFCCGVWRVMNSRPQKEGAFGYLGYNVIE